MGRRKLLPTVITVEIEEEEPFTCPTCRRLVNQEDLNNIDQHDN